MERISQRKHYDYTRSKTLLDAKVILKVSVRERKSLNLRKCAYPQIFFLYYTILSVSCFYKIYDLPKTALWSPLKTLFPFHLECKRFSKCKYKKITNIDKLTEICFWNRRM